MNFPNLKEKIARMIMVESRGPSFRQTTPSRAIRDFSLGGVILYITDLNAIWKP
jgi:hypothetical protein